MAQNINYSREHLLTAPLTSELARYIESLDIAARREIMEERRRIGEEKAMLICEGIKSDLETEHNKICVFVALSPDADTNDLLNEYLIEADSYGLNPNDHIKFVRVDNVNGYDPGFILVSQEYQRLDNQHLISWGFELKA
jgi:hypothetical protein